MLDKTKLVCPCENRSTLKDIGEGYICKDQNCIHHSNKNSFNLNGGVPVIISEEKTDTLCESSRVASYVSRQSRETLVGKIITHAKKLQGTSPASKKNCEDFLTFVSANSENPRILIIGSGEVGSAADRLNTAGVKVTGIDIYVTEYVDLVCDAHYLPFESESFDGVWIQAVLEHVMDPAKVVNEIHRVLRKDGTVYAETAFMQPVHEGAYDFTRFTVLGHRYLFKSFDLVDMGGVASVVSSLSWAIKYFFLAVTGSKKMLKWWVY
jgi:SAM-dependent methyltransferase